jgi:hypothetical protein
MAHPFTMEAVYAAGHTLATCAACRHLHAVQKRDTDHVLGYVPCVSCDCKGGPTGSPSDD